jgi:hypothetical protein
MHLADTFDATACSGFFTDDRLAGDIYEFSSCDLALCKGLTELFCSLVEGDDVVPGSFAAVLRIDRKREACCGTVVSGAEPWVSTEISPQLHLL